MDSKTYRNLIGHFATGVTVITTSVDGLLHGMTANAIASLSLDPTLLLVCVDKTAVCHRQLTAATHFAVNILGSDQEALSNAFARTTEPEKGRLGDASFDTGPHGSPLLEGALVHLECETTETLPGGDHDIFLGRVLWGQSTEGEPLLYYGGRYRRLEV